MDLRQISLLSFILIFLSLNYVYGIRTRDKMYEYIQGTKPCFRRLNGTHQVGCSSKRGGSTGVVHYCESQADLDFILKNGLAGPYIPVMPTNLFTASNMERLRSTKKVSGLLLYVDTEKKPEYFSHDNQCPNPKSSLENTCGGRHNLIWNPKGTGLLYEDIPFPVFFAEDAENVKGVKECFVQHNNFSYSTQRDRSLCSLDMLIFMSAATDTPTCIRRSNLLLNFNPTRFCDPLGDENVWASLFPLVTQKSQNSTTETDESSQIVTEPIKNFKYIIVAARLDTMSFFDRTAGATSPVTGIVTLLATAKFLKQILPKNDKSYEKNVLFVLFNGESFDYIGSQRFLYDMLKGDFPVGKDDGAGTVLPRIGIQDISFWVELSQLSNSGSLVAHNYFWNDPQAKKFIQELQSNRDPASQINFAESRGTLPPASLHTFLKNRTDLPGIVLADHLKSYTNRYYNSIYDNSSNIAYQYLNLSRASSEVDSLDDVLGDVPGNSIQRYIQNVSTLVGKAVYQEIVGQKYTGNDTADLPFVDELFHCYLENSSCRVNQAIHKRAKPFPPNIYVGVEVVSNFLTHAVGRTLAWVTADEVGEADGNCTNVPRNYAFKFYNMSKSIDKLNTTMCYRATMNYTEAKSPAFLIEDYDWSSGQYSTWTESTWGDIRVRIFLKPSAAHENMTISIGSIVMIFSFLFVYFVKSRSDILFGPCSLPTLAPTSC